MAPEELLSAEDTDEYIPEAPSVTCYVFRKDNDDHRIQGFLFPTGPLLGKGYRYCPVVFRGDVVALVNEFHAQMKSGKDCLVAGVLADYIEENPDCMEYDPETMDPKNIIECLRQIFNEHHAEGY